MGVTTSPNQDQQLFLLGDTKQQLESDFTIKDFKSRGLQNNFDFGVCYAMCIAKISILGSNCPNPVSHGVFDRGNSMGGL